MIELRLHLAPAVVRFLEATWPRAAARAERRAALLAVPGAGPEETGTEAVLDEVPPAVAVAAIQRERLIARAFPPVRAAAGVLTSARNPMTADPDPQVSHTDLQVSHIGPQVSHIDSRVSHIDPQVSHIDPQVSHIDLQVSHIDPQASHAPPIVMPPGAQAPAKAPAVARPRSIAEIVRVGAERHEGHPTQFDPEPEPIPGLRGLTPYRRLAAPATLPPPLAGRTALDQLATRVAERATRRNELLAAVPGSAVVQPDAQPQPSPSPAPAGTAAPGGPTPAREQPVPTSPDRAAPAPGLAEARLLEEAELRRMLSRIIRTDALRHGLDLKER